MDEPTYNILLILSPRKQPWNKQHLKRAEAAPWTKPVPWRRRKWLCRRWWYPSPPGTNGWATIFSHSHGIRERRVATCFYPIILIIFRFLRFPWVSYLLRSKSESMNEVGTIITMAPKKTRSNLRVQVQTGHFSLTSHWWFLSGPFCACAKRNSMTGWWLTYPLKNMSSSVGMIIPNIWKNKKCSKPPTSVCRFFIPALCYVVLLD